MMKMVNGKAVEIDIDEIFKRKMEAKMSNDKEAAAKTEEQTQDKKERKSRKARSGSKIMVLSIGEEDARRVVASVATLKKAREFIEQMGENGVFEIVCVRQTLKVEKVQQVMMTLVK